MASPAQPCTACRTQTKQTLHSRPHEGLRLVKERNFPGAMFGSVRETEYGCQDCGQAIIHSTSIQECAWRFAAG